VIYAFALALIQVLVASLVVREFVRGVTPVPGEVARATQVRSMARCLALMVPALLLGAPLVIEVLKAAELARTGATPWVAGNLDAWLTASGGALISIVFGLRFWRRRRAVPSFLGVGSHVLGVGSHVLGVVVGLNMLAVGGDQLLFVGDGADSGAVDWAFFREQGVSDMTCAKDLVLVRRDAADGARYRCPTSLVLGQFSAAPLIPWPSYTEGRSDQLSAAIRKLERESIQVPASTTNNVKP